MLTPWTRSVAGGRGQVLGLLWATSAHADGAQHAALHTHLRLLNPSPCRRMLSPKWQPGHRAYVLLETAAPVPGGGTELCHTHSAPGQSLPAPPPKRPMAHGSNQGRWLSVGSIQDQRADPSVGVTGYQAPHQAFGTHRGQPECCLRESHLCTGLRGVTVAGGEES